MVAMRSHNVPALRLEGFDGEWEEKTVQQISAPVTRVTPDSTAPVMMISAADGFINQSEKYSSDNAGKSLSKYIELHQGELAYNHGASKIRPFGSCFELRERAARVPFVYHCFRVPEEHPTFTSYSLNRKSVQSQLERLVSSGARMDGLLNISFPQYGTVTAHFPTLEEQQAIGAIFTNLDAAINQHTLKHKSLQQAKTALMQRMFPQEGQTVPELRLEGFDGEWKAKPFSEMVERSTLMSAKPSLPRVEYEDIVSGSGVLNKDLRFKESVKTGIYFQPGDVLYGKLRPYLKNWLLATFEGLAVGDFWVLRPKNTDSRYLYSLIQTNAFVDVTSVSSGSKMPRADWRLVSGTAFNTPPTLEEQQAIGAVFTRLDTLIATEAKYIESLKQAKAALLQRMFV